MKPQRERQLMAVLLLGVPAAVLWLLIFPATRRLAALHQRIGAAQARDPEVPGFVPVGRDERAFLEAPAARWRTRLAWVPDDGARLHQVDRVVGELSAALAAQGVRSAGMKAYLDPVQGDFSLPPALQAERPPGPGPRDLPEWRVGAWMLEVEILGRTGELFKALSAAASTPALLEPAGLRWELGPAGDGAAHRQYLQLRNVYLKPEP